MTEASALARSEYDSWPDTLRAAWDTLKPPEQRLMLRARMCWRGFTNPGENPPKAPLRRDDLNHVTRLLWEQEKCYRKSSACRGASGTVTLNTTVTRVQGARLEHTPDDALKLLRGDYDGSTLTELCDMLPGVQRPTLKKWMDMLYLQGQTHTRVVNGATLYYTTKDYRP